MNNYDKYVIAFSGGKDSIAMVLFLLEMGVPAHKIELWHHDIDGDGETFMDWEVTRDYCQKFADAFGIKIFFSYKVGGFKRELLRLNEKTAPTKFQNENHEFITVGGVSGTLARIKSLEYH